MLIWLLRILLVLVFCLIILVLFNRGDGSGSRTNFFVGCPNALAASQACCVTDRWFTPHFSILATLSYWCLGWLMFLAPLLVSLSGLPVGWILLIGLLHLLLVVVQDVWDVYRDVLGVVPEQVIHALRDAASRSSVDDFWTIWSKNAEAGLLHAYTLAGGPIGLLAILSFLLGVVYVFVVGDLVVTLLVVGALADFIVLLMVMKLIVNCAQCFVHSSLSPVLLFRRRLKSVADVLKGIKGKGFYSGSVGRFGRVLGGCLSSWSLWTHFFSSSMG